MLDTYAAFKRLTAAGMDEPQAEAIVDTIRTAVPEPRLDTFITKADVAAQRANISTFERQFTIKLYVGGAAVVVLLVALDFLIGP